MSVVHETLHKMIDDLNIQEAAQVIQLVKQLTKSDEDFKAGYRSEDDPILNGTLLFDESPDFSERIEEIVKEKVRGKTSGRSE